jgi:hypothetical protein
MEVKAHQLVKTYFDEVVFLRYTFKSELDTQIKILELAEKNNEDEKTKNFLSRVFCLFYFYLFLLLYFICLFLLLFFILFLFYFYFLKKGVQ